MSPVTPDAVPAESRAREAVRSPWTGLLLVDKPAGLTSHDVVDHVRRRFRVKRAGHLGTLDPAATGLLVVAIGAATRCARVWQGGEKTYEGTVRLGIETATQDVTGAVIEERPVNVDEAAVREAARSLVGELEQVPPMVSALRFHGERLHRLARAGVEVERLPRRVRVASWEWVSFALPAATFRVRCSGGTYVRTLAHDLGRRLGTGGALESLRRLRSEPFGVEQALPLRELDALAPEEAWKRAGIALERALSPLPSVTLDGAGAAAIGFGGQVAVAAADVSPGAPPPGGGARAGEAADPRPVAFLGPDGLAVALGELRADPAGEERMLACPRLVFPWAVRSGRSDPG